MTADQSISAEVCICTPHPYGDGVEVDCPVHGEAAPVYECGTETPGVCAWNPTCMVTGCAGRF